MWKWKENERKVGELQTRWSKNVKILYVFTIVIIWVMLTSVLRTSKYNSFEVIWPHESQ